MAIDPTSIISALQMATSVAGALRGVGPAPVQLDRSQGKAPIMMKKGGIVDILAEGDELIQGQNGTQEIEGPSHAQGGTPIQGQQGDFVFPKGPHADAHKKNIKQLTELMKLVEENPGDPFLRKTQQLEGAKGLERMVKQKLSILLDKYEKEGAFNGGDLTQQEEEPETMKRGGIVGKKYKLGAFVEDEETDPPGVPPSDSPRTTLLMQGKLGIDKMPALSPTQPAPLAAPTRPITVQNPVPASPTAATVSDPYKDALAKYMGDADMTDLLGQLEMTDAEHAAAAKTVRRNVDAAVDPLVPENKLAENAALYGTLAQLFNTAMNAAGTPGYVNPYLQAGDDSVESMDAAMRAVEGNYQTGLADLALLDNATRKSIQEGASSAAVGRAGELAAIAGSRRSLGQLINEKNNMLSKLYTGKASMELSRDQLKGQGKDLTQTTKEQQIDATFGALSSNIAGGMEQAMLVTKARNDSRASIEQVLGVLGQYGYSLVRDKNGNLKVVEI